MNFDLNNTLDSMQDGISDKAEVTHETIEEFHKNYISEIILDFGKYGDAAIFAVEMIPGVSEYNAIKDGDWQAFAIAAGIDIAAVAIGALTAGTGYAAIKGGTSVAKFSVKRAAKEIAEASIEKTARETVETGAKGAMKGIAEAGAEKAIKETLETNVEKATKETAEASVEKTAKEVSETGAERTVLKVGDKIDKTRFSEYVDEIEKITSREILSQQKELLEKALKEQDFSKLSKEDYALAKRDFKNKKAELIQTWEIMTGNEWPRYTQDVLNEAGDVVRRVGQPYDVHHIIELSTSGPNECWNIHPASFPDEHQGGIHAAGSLARLIFG